MHSSNRMIIPRQPPSSKVQGYPRLLSVSNAFYRSAINEILQRIFHFPVVLQNNLNIQIHSRAVLCNPKSIKLRPPLLNLRIVVFLEILSVFPIQIKRNTNFFTFKIYVCGVGMTDAKMLNIGIAILFTAVAFPDNVKYLLLHWLIKFAQLVNFLSQINV